jgi:acyl carrier protein
MMDRSALLRSLQEMLEEDRGEKFDALDESVALRDGLGLDSVDLVTLVMQVQDQFRVVLTSDELEHVVTLGDLLDLMQSKLGTVSKAA